jgi:hypothetical protein
VSTTGITAKLNAVEGGLLWRGTHRRAGGRGEGGQAPVEPAPLDQHATRDRDHVIAEALAVFIGETSGAESWSALEGETWSRTIAHGSRTDRAQNGLLGFRRRHASVESETVDQRICLPDPERVRGLTLHPNPAATLS